MFEIRLSKIISYIFHPLLMPTCVIIIFFNLNLYYSFILTDHTKIRITGLVFITTFIFPLIINLIFLRHKVINSLYLKAREERMLPFIVTGIFYYMTYHLIKQLLLPDFYKLFLLGASLLVLIALVVNFFRKISLHMIAIGGVTGIFLGLSFKLMLGIPYLIIVLIFISGLIAYSRIRLEQHKPVDVYSGYLVGFAVLFALYMFI